MIHLKHGSIKCIMIENAFLFEAYNFVLEHWFINWVVMTFFCLVN